MYGNIISIFLIGISSNLLYKSRTFWGSFTWWHTMWNFIVLL